MSLMHASTLVAYTGSLQRQAVSVLAQVEAAVLKQVRMQLAAWKEESASAIRKITVGKRPLQLTARGDLKKENGQDP